MILETKSRRPSARARSPARHAERGARPVEALSPLQKFCSVGGNGKGKQGCGSERTQWVLAPGGNRGSRRLRAAGSRGRTLWRYRTHGRAGKWHTRCEVLQFGRPGCYPDRQRLYRFPSPRLWCWCSSPDVVWRAGDAGGNTDVPAARFTPPVRPVGLTGF